MHLSSYQRVAAFAEMVRERFGTTPIRVLDVGGADVNGTYRELFSWEGVRYVALDTYAGKNVDVVVDNPYVWEQVDDDSFDVVICGQTLEHTEFPRRVMEQIAKKLKPGGLACVVVPSQGPEHRYPVDCYRFLPDGLEALGRWAGLITVDRRHVSEGEVFPDGSEIWRDTSCIFTKAPKARTNNTTRPWGKTLDGLKSCAFNPIDYPVAFAEPRRIAPSAWLEHVPFGMALVEMLRPGLVVELGTFTGVSYCGFCEAISLLGLDCQAYAIDTWKGDPHSGPVEEEVFEQLSRFHDQAYGNFSSLLRCTFDEALPNFADQSIDLLHIDGYHTYDAARHDFVTWMPKLSQRAVVVLHDICVRREDYGVWRLWEEIKRQYPTFEFWHQYGLGVAAVGQEIPAPIKVLVELNPEEARLVRRFYKLLGGRLSLRLELDQITRLREAEQVRHEQQLLAERIAELDRRTADMMRWASVPWWARALRAGLRRGVVAPRTALATVAAWLNRNRSAGK